MSSNRNIHKPTVYLQESCLKHQYIRSRDTSSIVERPERLRAVNIGLSAAIARLEQVEPRIPNKGGLPPRLPTPEAPADPDDLAAALDRLNIERDDSATTGMSPVVSIVKSRAKVDILKHPAVEHIHRADGDVYLDNLVKWATTSAETLQHLGSEIPDGLSQGDLYLCPESLEAISGALGTVCEAVDKVISSSRHPDSTDSPSTRAFVAVRPPGHHCGDNSPCGFCFVNNVAVGAAQAHLKHGIDRVVIFDIDLHHGNGTQSIVWQINEESHQKQLEIEAGAQVPKGGLLRVYYGSAHDILSYPCEDGKPELIQAASVSIHQAHGQYIENVHLAPYTSEEQFWDELYDKQYGKLLRTAADFLESTGGPGDDAMIFISCGMDACEHEYPTMQRHGRKVPTSLYYRFTQDACRLSEKYAGGRLVSILEGGYSDRALTSGTMAHLCGFFAATEKEEDRKTWWSLENLEKLEKVTKKRRGGRSSLGGANLNEPWLERAQEIFQQLDTPVPKPALPSSHSRNLRERKAGTTSAASPSRTSPGRPAKKAATKASGRSALDSPPLRTLPPLSPVHQLSFGAGTVTNVGVAVALPPAEPSGPNVPLGLKGEHATSSEEESSPDGVEGIAKVKKLPRIKLKLGPKPDTEA